MKKETTVTFEESDFELLKGTIPRNPCLKCTPAERMSCCGCPEQREYREKMKPFADACIEEYAYTFLDLHDNLDQLCAIVRSMQSDIEHLPEQLKDIVMNSDIVFYKRNQTDVEIYEMFKSIVQEGKPKPKPVEASDEEWMEKHDLNYLREKMRRGTK